MSSVTVSPLLERETELEQLGTSLERAAGGSGAVVAIEGPAGIGKTRLLRAALEAADRQGMLALGARGLERERDLPFSVVRQLFEPTLRRLGSPACDSLLSGAARLAAAVVSPHEMAEHPPRAEASLLHGLYWLVTGLSELAPVVLAVDDVHWSDRASLSFARYVAQRLEGLPVLLAVTVRSTDREAQVVDVQTLVDGASPLIQPRPLSAAALAELVHGRFAGAADDDFCDACRAATGGNPFLVWELLLELEREAITPSGANASRISAIAPASVSRAVLSRIHPLPVSARSLVEALAVLGDPAELRTAAIVADLDQDAAAEAADDLARSGILESGRPLSFRHPLVRAAVYGGLAPASRADMHARAARLLAADGAPPERCAVHFLNTEGKGNPDVVGILRAAARRSLARGAADSAVTYLRRALVEPPLPETRAQILHELGHAELRAGELIAVERLELALSENQDPTARAAIARELARALLMSGASGSAIELLDRESAVARESDRESGLRLEAESLSLTWVERGASGVEPDRIDRARALAGATPGERAVLAAAVPLVAATGDTPAVDIAELCERALGNGQLLEELSSESPPFVLVAQELAYTDELDTARAHLDDGIEDARSGGSAMGFFFCSGMRSMVSYRQGELLDALSFATQAVDVARQHGWVTSFPTGSAILADSLIERGELDAADAVLAEAQPVREPLTRRAALMFNQVLYRRAVLRLARGDAEEAVNDLLELDARKRRIGDLNPGRHPLLATLAVALSAAGDKAAAADYAGQALERAGRWGAQSSIGIALRADALARPGPNRVDRLRESVAVLEASPARLEHARALVDLGANLRGVGARAPAREALRQALDLADRCGATVLAEGARRELVAAGGRPRRPRTSGAQALTPSERRVAEMARSGLSNPEIAQSLFVTRKTVETHLSSVYRKLGIHTRDQLIDRLR